ncbi:hypothetical protein QLX08_011605 [Tetragonisca angustula]|uniref:Uncharacterized protein n=1 Tax=Tetragonisca angustula TaxID=166442 RepID=A0AAW0Z832_9HYME
MDIIRDRLFVFTFELPFGWMFIFFLMNFVQATDETCVRYDEGSVHDLKTTSVWFPLYHQIKRRKFCGTTGSKFEFNG